MILLVFSFVACVFLPNVYGASTTIVWCYHLPSCNYTTWPSLSTTNCNGDNQSPIDIVSASATGDTNLTAFNFINYDNNSTLKEIKNSGKTVQVQLSSGVQVSGGGLSEVYDALQFHLHWGNGSAVPGSEHTVDGKRYPMEMHIVNVKSSYQLNTTLAVTDSTGLAALGFLIEAMPGNDTGLPASWKTLTSYLTNISKNGYSATVSVGISLDDLLVGVDRTKYYRYSGSLTTPSCNEAVVWTVFKDTVKVSKDLIDLFSSTVYIGNTTSSTLMTNTFRGIQSPLPVTTQVQATTAAPSEGSQISYSLGLICLAMLISRA